MDENNNKFTGDELSEENNSGNESFVGDELDENPSGDGEFTGNELGEGADSGQEILANASPKRFSSPSISPGKLKKKKVIQKWVWGIGALITVLFMGVGGFFFIQYTGHDRSAGQSLLTVKVPIPPTKEMWLKDFLIPLRPKHLYTCVSFSVVIRSWDKAFLQRQPHEKQWIRGVLYDILMDKVQLEEETPSLDKFKEWMIQAVRYELPTSQIDTVDIHNFLVL